MTFLYVHSLKQPSGPFGTIVLSMRSGYRADLMLFTVIPASILTGGSSSNALEVEWDREEWQLLVVG
jgi:hypothetical protein